MNKILLGSAVTLLLLTGCNNEDKKVTTNTTAKETTTPITQVNNEVQKTATAVTSKIAENKDVKTQVNNTSKEEKKLEQNTVQKIEDKKEVVQNIQQIQPNKDVAVSKEQSNVVSQSEDASQGLSGEEIFKSCAPCHGQKAEKEALGKSQIIKGWEKQKIIEAINGYKAGTYGGIMKNIMKGQVANKTDIEIDAVATFISNL